MIKEIAAVGATHIALVVTWAQRDIFANEIAPGDVTINDGVVRSAIRKAHAEGLEVLLFPILTISKTRRGEWRGTVAPANVAKWWLSYEAFILHYAAIAASEKTAAFLVGSELSSTEGWRDRWYHLISQVERSYKGTLVYSANWDHYPAVSFWRRVNYIGVTGYFELTRDTGASIASLTKAWSEIRGNLTSFAAEQNKPLWITEVGYTSTDGAAVQPWDYTTRGKLDLEEQRRCYAAFRAAWEDTDELGGVFFWNWNGKGGGKDRGYTPRGKPAEKILRSWYRGR